MRSGLVVVLCACNAHISDGVALDGQATGGDATPTIDAIAALGPWGSPALVPGASTAKAEDDCTMSSATDELVFAVVETTAKHLYSITRANPQAMWSAPVRLPFDSADPSTDQSPRFSLDDLTLYFGSDRAGGAGEGDIWMVTRPTVGGTWGTPNVLASVNSVNDERWFVTCGDGTHYMIVIDIAGSGTGNDLYEGTLGGGPPQRASVLDSTSSDTSAYLSRDCLTTYFASSRGGSTALYTSTRTSLAAAWLPPTLVTDFTLADQQDPWLSDDQRTFVFASNAAGTNDIYLSTR